MDHLRDYEKIRTVGKGAFGTAVLYRKISTDTLVVLKEINTQDLSPTERQMALNEVGILSSLNHPNIIAYGGNFEHQGMLMIEMEYADSGTLAQLISSSTKYFPERKILTLLQQISSAIAHMHAHNILHRDLKTANVFMNSGGHVKIGDFGISKVLTTNAQAQTVLGTPYYISPEMCEGKDYNEKSDIWAMGCILYEMCCLHRTFQASSLPALVSKIMKAEYKQIPSGYSDKLNNMVRELLDKIPDRRPTARDVIEKRIPEILSSLGSDGYIYIDPCRITDSSNSLSQIKSSRDTHERSVIYQVKSFENNVNIYPIQLPPKFKILHVATGYNHFIAVTDGNAVFTWGEGSRGQLGHGDTKQWLQYPTIVDSLSVNNIIMSGAGEGFSLFLTMDGKVFSCGEGNYGALGHGHFDSCFKPTVIESLSRVHISSISCGSTHAAALSTDHQLYLWGQGNKGQTAQKSLLNICIPTRVDIETGIEPVSIHCGGESTVVITSRASLIACGWNVHNKLALSTNSRSSFKSNKNEIITSMKEVHIIPGAIIDCSVGILHCAVIVKLMDGTRAVYTTGCPHDSFLSSNIITQFAPVKVTDLEDTKITMVKCGPTYTVVGTEDNCILLWGTRYGVRGSVKVTMDIASQESSGVWLQGSHLNKNTVDGLPGSSTSLFTKYLTSTYLPETIKKPVRLLALYSSPEQIQEGSFMILEGLFPLAHSILVLVNTTAPLAKETNKNSTNEHVLDNERHDQDCDTIGPLPDWLKADIALTKYSWSGQSK